MQNKKNNSGRFSWVDIAKGIAIILVVYRHVLIGIKRSGLVVEPYLLQINEMVYSFRMPLFFILSGFFFARSAAKRGRGEFVTYKLSSLVYPYLVWAVIQVSIQILLSDYTNANRGLKDYLYILIQPRAIDQLWFLFALFNVTLFIFLLREILKVNRWVVLGISLVAVYGSTFVKNYSLIHDLLFYMPYFVIGDLVSEEVLSPEFQRRLSSMAGLLIMLPIFAFSQWYWLNHPDINVYGFGAVAAFGSFFIIAVALRIGGQNWTKILALVGKHSLQVYLAHVLFSSAFRMLFTKGLGIDNVYLLLFLGLTTGVAFPILLAMTGKKIMPVNWLFSPPKF